MTIPSRKPYGCVFWPTYLLAFLVFFVFVLLAAACFFGLDFALAFGSAVVAVAGAAFAAGAGTVSLPRGSPRDSSAS